MPDYEGWPPRPVNGAAMFKSDLTPVKVEREDRKKAKAKLLEDAYRKVEQRDQMRSRVTGIRLSPSAISAKERWEHNHIKKRSTYPSLRAAVKNIHLCSAYEHNLITNHWIEVEGTDANGDLFFHWNDEYAKGRRPIVIKRQNPRREEIAVRQVRRD